MPVRLPSPAALRAAARTLPQLAAPPEANGPIAVAVSGGADSVYLLCALWADEVVRPRLHVLHFDHRVRGEASGEDARFVSALCAALGVPCGLGLRAGQGAAAEADLRSARDAFFAEQRQALGYELLCTAHHLDDVVENALLRFARGAGLAGLAAPRPLQGFRDGHRRWRPLIEAGLAKPALLAALRAAGIPWREDGTNGLPIAARNRIRAWLAAGGDSALGAGYPEGFARSARIIGEAQEALAGWARELGCVCSATGTMPVGALQGRPEVLAQECLREFLHRHGVVDPSGPSLRPLTTALVAGGEAQSAVRGVVVCVKGGELFVRTAAPSFGPAERRLRVGFPDEECGLLAEIWEVDAALWVSLSRGDIAPTNVVYVAAPPAPLVWRGRTDGDRFQPLGSPGSAKLSDLLINRKIPANLRESLPVVLCGGEILWVPGLPPAENARLTGPTKGAVRLTWDAPWVG